MDNVAHSCSSGSPESLLLIRPGHTHVTLWLSRWTGYGKLGAFQCIPLVQQRVCGRWSMMAETASESQLRECLPSSWHWCSWCWERSGAWGASAGTPWVDYFPVDWTNPKSSQRFSSLHSLLLVFSLGSLHLTVSCFLQSLSTQVVGSGL